ncbi:MAG: beta-hydroxyacyl-(acyl-carrier-protein) dehydratase FabZ [Rickettsiaceae bacterium]|jgi:3-hydroxyacyl-[acyl-carrier-protein] dehydratase|nr:beta-hydroxyacyl-(acyl-carrier-protein) dehydratase FabZ [Rickettsiaceae bacterium]
MNESNQSIIDIDQIINMIPHRYPLLLIDRVTEINEDGIVALKNVTFNEPHFTGHFPNKPIMPGVLIIEAIAQASAIFTVKTLGEEANGKLVYFMSIDNAKFRKPVVPGDSLYIHVKKLQNRGAVWKFEGEGRVNGKRVAEATVTAMIMDK